MASPLKSRRWWALPTGVPVHLVETEEALEDARELMDAAVCCAIDAEWPPEETVSEQAHRGSPPHATLVQLALWLPLGVGSTAAASTNGSSSGAAGSNDGGGGYSCCVLLLDMLRLPQAAAKAALQAVFRNKACLKLGFGLVHDLRAIAGALGGEGGSCIAVVEPACDVGSVHRFLRHQRVSGVHKAVDLGLSGLVEAQLGLPLDKSQQCSSWGRRPLSPEQLAYAAADAACLLGLLGSLVQAAGRPEDWPMVEAEAPPGEVGQVAHAAAAAGDAPCEDGRGGTAGAEAAEPADQAQSGSAAGAAAGMPAAQGQQQPADDAALPHGPPPQPARALLGGCSLQQVRAAAGAWGSRLEISGSRAVRRSSKRGGQRRRQQQRAAAGTAALAPGCSGFPLHVPWMDAQRRLTGAPRFLCDVMAEGLARQLRLCGFDAESLQASMERAPRHAVYRAMTERGEGEGRVVLTRDRTFVAAAYCDQAFLVQADTKRAQLEEVLAAFGLGVAEEELLTRCARCNGQFLPEPLPAAALPAGHGVPPGILEKHPEFWVCARCEAVFWQGNQYSRAKQQMTELIHKMDAASLR